jgi:hypothetical protein
VSSFLDIALRLFESSLDPFAGREAQTLLDGLYVYTGIPRPRIENQVLAKQKDQLLKRLDSRRDPAALDSRDSGLSCGCTNRQTLLTDAVPPSHLSKQFPSIDH